MSEPTPEDLWTLAAIDAAYDLGVEAARLRDSQPADGESALELVMDTLATELWDQNFSQTEIREAFEGAIAALPAYAVYERRSDEPRS